MRRPTFNNQQNEQETIRLGDSSSQSDTYDVVEYNRYGKKKKLKEMLTNLPQNKISFVEQNGETEVVSSKSNRNIFRYNTFYHCQGTLTLRRADYNQGICENK